MAVLHASRLLLALSLLSPVIANDSAGAVRTILDKDTGITIREGFDAELLYEVPKSQGSWVSMTFDPKGRLIVSDQDDKGAFRVTLPKQGDAEGKVHVESLPGFPYEPIDWGKRKVGGALGLLYAFDSLYLSNMQGLYRIKDTDGDDKFDEFTLLKKLNVGYEHSAHNVILAPDGKNLLLVSGNYTRIPQGATSLQPRVWQEDSLIVPIPDPMGHAVGLMAPGGWIAQFSPDAKDWKIIASGFRNPVDLAVNREGEIFTYDSDLEFEFGVPWYRPTRVNHVTSAAEFGWRTASTKWHESFADSLGAVINVGPGSPTGISFGHHSNFPAAFQDKLFICDWTFGTIFTVEMEEDGSSYKGKMSEFLHGSPLNIAAMRFGPDGHMYFVTGGRTTASRLYRVRYNGEKTTDTVRTLVKNQAMRDLRHSLEKFHDGGKSGATAIEKAWPHLSHDDRAIRYAARLAIENQSLALWQEKSLAEKNPRATIYAAIALSRHGKPELSEQVLSKLNALDYAALPLEDRLALMRAYSLSFMRLGNPKGDAKNSVITRLDALYPAKDNAENAELCRVLSYLEAPSVVSKTIALMKSTRAEQVGYDQKVLGRHEYGVTILQMIANAPNTRNIHYAYCLRNVRTGWTVEDRKYLFGWLNDTLIKNGGKSFSGHIQAIRKDTKSHLSEKDAAEIKDLLADVAMVDLSKLPKAVGPAGLWTVDSAMKLFTDDLSGRNFENGKKMFSAAYCIACHRTGGEGGNSGPDLGSVGNRFSIRDILVAICEPSESISEQYMANTVTLKDGSSIYGRLITKNDKEVGVATNPFDLSQIKTAPADQVKDITLSQVSLMPPGMIAGLNQDELKDLVAYLISGGDPKHKAFK